MRPGALARSLIAIAAALIAVSPSAGQDSRGTQEGRIKVETEATLDAGKATIHVYCAVKGASVYIDRVGVGLAPYTGSLAPGDHYVEVSVPGYYPLGEWIVLAEKTEYTLRFSPALITGFISIDAEPRDAEIAVDGKGVERGLVEVPVGRHIVVARRFGYVERRIEVRVLERSTSLASFALEKAPFEVSGLGFSRRAFNPGNAGAPGSTSLEFRASSYGSAKAEIRGPGGEIVATLDFGELRAWSQSMPWDGRGPDGAALPDGPYVATLTAVPAPGVPLPKGTEGDGTVTAVAEARIDSSIVVRALGSAQAMPGLLLAPDPRPRPAGTVAAETAWVAPLWSPSASAFGLSAALSLGGSVVLGLGAAEETGGDFAPDLSLSILVSLLGGGAGAADGAIFLRGSYSGSADPVLPGSYDGLEASLPLGARLVRLGGVDLKLTLSPGLLADLSSAEPSFLGLGRAGLWLEGRSFAAGLSGSLRLGFAGGIAPAWPAEAALEGRLMLGSTPLVASGLACARLGPGSSARYSIGLGLGLLF